MNARAPMFTQTMKQSLNKHALNNTCHSDLLNEKTDKTSQKFRSSFALALPQKRLTQINYVKIPFRHVRRECSEKYPK